MGITRKTESFSLNVCKFIALAGIQLVTVVTRVSQQLLFRCFAVVVGEQSLASWHLDPLDRQIPPLDAVFKIRRAAVVLEPHSWLDDR